jgi:hypothetical protein
MEIATGFIGAGLVLFIIKVGFGIGQRSIGISDPGTFDPGNAPVEGVIGDWRFSNPMRPQTNQ